MRPRIGPSGRAEKPYAFNMYGFHLDLYVNYTYLVCIVAQYLQYLQRSDVLRRSLACRVDDLL